MRLNNKRLQELAVEFHKKHRASVEATKSLVDLESADATQLSNIMDLYDPFIADGKKYLVGDVFRHDGELYKVIVEHTTEKEKDLYSNIGTIYHKYEAKQ